jgi:hypothetical protein
VNGCFSKPVFLAALSGLAMNASLAFAANDARSSVHITANIPTQQFHVQPRDPEFGKNEVMYYNPLKQDLGVLRQTFDVKNTDGSIHAYLPGGHARLTNGRDYIPLLVRFNNVTLWPTPQEVVDDAASTPGTQAELTIRAGLRVRDDQTGLYNADFTVVFDAVPRMLDTVVP